MSVQLVGLGRPDLPSVTPVAVVHAPISVLPTPFPRASFDKARAAATLFNKLIDRVALDDEYLQKTLASAGQYDEFTVHAPGFPIDRLNAH